MQTKLLEVAITKRSAMDQPDFQVYAFGKAIGMPPVKVVQDGLLPILKRLDKGFQSPKAAGFDSLDPSLQLLLGALPAAVLIEPVAEIFFQLVTGFQFG